MKVRELNRVLEECCFNACVSGEEIDPVGDGNPKLFIQMAKNALEDIEDIENVTNSLTSTIRLLAIALFLHKE